MALRREDLSPEELRRQQALDRSWAAAQRDLADPGFRERLGDSLQRLDATPAAPLVTSEVPPPTPELNPHGSRSLLVTASSARGGWCRFQRGGPVGRSCRDLPRGRPYGRETRDGR